MPPLLTGSMLATAAALLGGTALAAEPAELPPGPGRDLTVKTCVRCHQADVITRRRMSRPEWKDMVDVMVRMGASANAKQKAEIVKYLSKALPPATSAVAKAVPKAENRSRSPVRARSRRSLRPGSRASTADAPSTCGDTWSSAASPCRFFCTVPTQAKLACLYPRKSDG